MAIERTAQNLATFCLQVVGAPYWMGCFGQKADRSLYNYKKSQYSTYYPPKSWTEASFTDDFGKRVTDCAGLIKWFLWSDNMTNKNPTYKSSEDWGSDTLYKKCKEKGKISTIPSNKIGICVFKLKNGVRTHVGVVVDNSGKVVEAKGHAYGTVTSKVSDWDEWGKHPLIKYDTAPAPQPQPTPEPTPEPTPVLGEYTVKVNTYLSLRNGPSVRNTELGKLYNGAKVTVVEVKSNWAKVGPNLWCCMDYLRKN